MIGKVRQTSIGKTIGKTNQKVTGVTKMMTSRFVANRCHSLIIPICFTDLLGRTYLSKLPHIRCIEFLFLPINFLIVDYLSLFSYSPDIRCIEFLFLNYLILDYLSLIRKLPHISFTKFLPLN